MNTLRHLFLALGRDDPEAAFRRHARALNTRMPEAMRTIALDGKTLRGSFDYLNDSTAAHLLSAFAGDAALILAHPELAGAPGEIPAPPRVGRWAWPDRRAVHRRRAALPAGRVRTGRATSVG